jgi:hypothetical protein
LRRIHLCLPALAGVLLLAAGSSSAESQKPTRATAAKRAAPALARRRIVRQRRIVVHRIAQIRKETWHWQRVMGRRPTPTVFSAEDAQSLAYSRWVLRLWNRRAIHARLRAQHPPHLADWLCIFSHENGGYGWSANTGNGYYGGLQMDLQFQRTYAPGLLRKKGTANHWTPLEQIWVAELARTSGRGFYPWPNTAAMCGLI